MATSAPNGQTISVCGNTFRLIETIGKGSYGTVHKAINVASDAYVAIKVISKEKLKRTHERRNIEKEIETMRVAVEEYENGHPHIVRLLCTKESQHHIFIVLEYCAGGDLSLKIKSSRGMGEDLAREYMSQLAKGLQFLRSQKIVHRDLKPANLLLSSTSATAKLKIADFGFARELQSESLAESVVGSPLYMAPELLEFKSYDAKADLWSVGIILYEMLVNDHPFLIVNKCHASNHLALRRNIQKYFEMNGRVSLPSNVGASEECAYLLERLLQPDPQRRISFEEFFTAKFLLPPRPNVNEAPCSTSTLKQPLVDATRLGADDDWVIDSGEYVIVEKEYEDVGREVLDEKDLESDFIPATPPAPAKATSSNEKAAPAAPVPHSGETLREVLQAIDLEAEEVIKETSATPKTSEVLTSWKDDNSRLEELLGLCYRSFDVGSVALFVPTPRGDYIAFHEGCPHYYLAQESIDAAKRNGKVPPYVLGCIVFCEPGTTTDGNNPFHLRNGTSFHTVMVSALSDNELAPDASSSTNTPTRDFLSSPSPNYSSVGSSRVIEQYSPGITHIGQHDHQRISFRSFQISDLALFFQKAGKSQYLAFNEKCPNYYLAEESIHVAKQAAGGYPAYILGVIIFVDTFQATEDFNPYRLSYGTRFFVVTVDVAIKK